MAYLLKQTGPEVQQVLNAFAGKIAILGNPSDGDVLTWNERDGGWTNHSGQSIFIRYSRNADGTDFTATWEQGEYYVGIGVGIAAPQEASGYTWAKFVGEQLDFNKETETTDTVNHTVVNNTVTAFESSQLATMNLTIPTDVFQGYYAEVDIATGSNPVAITYTNNSNYNIVYMQYAIDIGEYNAVPADTNANLLFSCDGIDLTCFVVEKPNVSRG